MLYIKAANYADIEKEWLFVKEMPTDENGLTNEWSGCSRKTFEKEALPQMIAYSEGRNLPEGFVPETCLFLWEDDVIIGQFRIRHYLCESLRTGAGHIGYFIGKEFRGKGYGTKGLRIALEVARNIVPEPEFYLRVNKDNPASLHVMMNNGGKVVAEDDTKFYVRIPNMGKC
ncbi:MAG: GNAT family N-acetyltransferase [Lachnospiraceae bacterium]|nr:GNAT family N-acetyltransferase [Lachnospiraceae bacterium]